MRKSKLFLILLLTLTLVWITAFSKSNTPTNAASPSGSDIFDDPNFVQPDYPIDDYLKAVVKRDGERKMISKGAAYSSDFLSSEHYPDNEGKELTDGQRGQLNFMDPEWTGFELKGESGLTLTLDLGEMTDGISDIELSVLSWASIGATAPDSVKFSFSNDGESFIDLGTTYMSGNNIGVYDELFTLRLGKSVSARYIRAILPAGSWWLFMDEFAVYTYEEKVQTEIPVYGDLGKLLYTSEPIAKVENETFWDSSENDYENEINLVKGLIQKVYVPLPLTDRYYTSYKNSTADSPFLTDGIKDSSIWSDKYYKSVHGIERNIVFDLTKTSVVSGVNIGIAQNGASGIYPPRLVEVWLSDNGVEWEKVYHHGAVTGPDNSRFDFRIDLDKKYKARFINIKLGISTFVYLDEIEVFGTKKVGGDAVALRPTGSFETEFKGDYVRPNEEIYSGAQHVLLAPFMKDASKPSEGITAEQWLPYIAYLDKSGAVKDTMFDSVLMGEYNTTFGSQRDAASLRNYIENLFSEGYNLDALDSVAEDVKKALGLKELKIPVTLSLPSLNRNFVSGDYNGDGVVENLSTLEGLKAVADWFMSEVEKSFGDAEYKNLEFHGYYWMHEAVEYQMPFETDLIRYISDKSQEKGYLLSWIPWNNASGYQEWDKLGFGVTSMQPNYAWYDHSKEVIEEIAMEAKLLGMSVEIEIHPSAPFSKHYFDNYAEYLRGGIDYGYMDAINFYYQGGMPGEYYVSYSDGSLYGRAIYDYTYRYIKGTLIAEKLTDSDRTVNLFAGKSYNGKLNEAEAEHVFYELGVSPTYGSVKLSPNGDFTYIPMDGFEGNDSFTYTCYNGFSEQKDVNVTIKVRKELVESSDADLKQLSVDGKPILGFDPAVTSYTVHVPYAKTSVSIAADAHDTKAKVAIAGGHNLAVGANAVTVTVTAQDSSTKTYTINVIRQAAVLVTAVDNGNKQTTVRFPIKSANGKGYSVYLSESGVNGSFKRYDNVNYNAKGVNIKKLTNGNTYYVYITYEENDMVTMQSAVIELKPQ
ncbi:DUF4855 domain-containing protein [Paenibacillus sp. IITD108]|uniref:DUF4855 domain-containing protein n=1 Tax=Paenibacillus sp. IITD108 TaxID=3116649 RepID=UPI002F3FCBA4